ncbi:hypothetical protein NVP1084O_208 [Vibrio phage 1.084.O._10N.261.49.F5]|nr:hypothetical protein NVP1084O_208 [Vibrio phage 1.084.O._10N.261.49.F5]
MLIQTNTLNLNIACTIAALCDKIAWNNTYGFAHNEYVTTANLQFDKIIFDHLMNVVVKSEFDQKLQSQIEQCEEILKQY